MSDTDKLTCPECGERLKLDEEWIITDTSLIGTEVASGETIQGDYAHADCMPAQAMMLLDK
jgi:hypothetical protein